MKLLYRETETGYYYKQISYWLVGEQAVFRQCKYYKYHRLINNEICQVVGSLSEVEKLIDSVDFKDGVLWFKDIERPVTNSFNLVKLSEAKQTVKFKLNSEIMLILEVLKNAN